MSVKLNTIASPVTLTHRGGSVSLPAGAVRAGPDHEHGQHHAFGETLTGNFVFEQFDGLSARRRRTRRRAAPAPKIVRIAATGVTLDIRGKPTDPKVVSLEQAGSGFFLLISRGMAGRFGGTVVFDDNATELSRLDFQGRSQDPRSTPSAPRSAEQIVAGGPDRQPERAGRSVPAVRGHAGHARRPRPAHPRRLLVEQVATPGPDGKLDAPFDADNGTRPPIAATNLSLGLGEPHQLPDAHQRLGFIARRHRRVRGHRRGHGQPQRAGRDPRGHLVLGDQQDDEPDRRVLLGRRHDLPRSSSSPAPLLGPGDRASSSRWRGQTLQGDFASSSRRGRRHAAAQDRHRECRASAWAAGW